MSEADIASVAGIADRVHLDYPEDAAVFAERQRLYPEGCRVLVLGGEVSAYIISHPWCYLEPPSLNTMLGKLPDAPTTYYIHDIALLPAARGSGAASVVIAEVLGHAASTGAANASLVAVGGTEGFWGRYGFRLLADPLLDKKLRSYDETARYMVRDL
jgi:ribosomal protein S18 acetylase RimI-like enzyme